MQGIVHWKMLWQVLESAKCKNTDLKGWKTLIGRKKISFEINK